MAAKGQKEGRGKRGKEEGGGGGERGEALKMQHGQCTTRESERE